MMVLSTITVLFTVDVFAEDATDAETGTEVETGDAESNAPTVAIDHLTHYFATPEEKLATMKLAYEQNGVCLYVDSVSGEVAYVNKNTGEKLFTNPYDVASTTGNDATKQEILSQIIVQYKKTSAGINDATEKLTSFLDAAERGQITVENIKNGVRVEYAIGREQSKMLVPRLISMERFEEMILAPLLEVFGAELYNPRSQNSEVFDVQKMLSYYMVYSVDALDRNVYSAQDIKNIENTFGGLFENLRDSDAQYARALKQFPVIETMDVYVFDPKAGDKELARAEEIIMKYCPEYTYEELAYDHILTDYQSDDSNPPLFRMALEYKITEDGLQVTLPANGIRFNESLYTLEAIQILPYMGAGNTAYNGYNFFPDGSGALFDFKGYTEQVSVEGKVYGDDYTRSEIAGKYQNAIRYPVFGIVEETVYYTYQKYDKDGQLIEENKIAGNIVEAVKAFNKEETVSFCNGQAEGLAAQYGSIITDTSTDEKKVVEKSGFICIVEEGDALASITTLNEPDARADYSTIKVAVTPRPKDKFKLEGSDDEIPVVSERKYVGNYTMKYITLSDAEKAKEEGKEATVYDASWFGMAVAYRDYLTRKGIISPLTSSELTSDIPLYIETFGAIETTEKILSIPVTVMAPLTTFDNIETIYDELYADGMKNINFKLTGYANGGMWSTIPGNLKFEKAVGGNDGFQELLDKANDENAKDDTNLGIFPDFDFAYVRDTNIFSGYSSYKHTAKTIDDRYASKKEWSATQQKYVNYFEMVVSPAYFVEFYEKLKKNYADKYEGEIGISVSTLGTALNSDFDEDEPYNREDSKGHTVEAFQHFDSTYGQVMTDGGNAYTWKYVDHMLGVALDSSRYNFASRSVPFIGVVLHGSMRFAGEPLNMEGDLQYAMLKAIENGASPYFVLSYQNTDVLKQDAQLSKYYSIRYDIWGDDIKNNYTVLNDVLSDVQDKFIVGHEFLMNGVRIPDSDELINDILLQYELLLNSHKNAAELLEKELQMAASTARENGRIAEAYATEAVLKVVDLYKSQMSFVGNSACFGEDFYNNLKDAYAEYCTVMYSKDPAVKAQKDRIENIYNIVQDHNLTLAECKTLYDDAYAKYATYLGGKDYKSYKDAIAAVYKDYAGGKINASQLEYAIQLEIARAVLDSAIAEYKSDKISLDDLMAAINAYGAAYVNTEAYDAAVNSYLGGNIAYEKVVEAAKAWNKTKDSEDAKNAFTAAIEAYNNGTLADSALTTAVEAWYADIAKDTAVYDDAALAAAIASFKAGGIKANKLTDTIGMYFFNKLDKAEILAGIDALKAAKPAYDQAEINYSFEVISAEDLAELKKAYESAKVDYEKQLTAFNDKQNISLFQNPLKKYNDAKLAYELGLKRSAIDKTDAEAIYEAQKAIYTPICNAVVYAAAEGMNVTEAAAAVADYRAKADAYNKYLAAEDAFEDAQSSGFDFTFDDCYTVYYNRYKLDIYKDYGALLKSISCSAADSDAYYSYYDADITLKALANDIYESKPSTGAFDNYIRALAVYDHLVANRATLEALDKSKFDSDFAKYENMVKSTRRTALTNTSAVGIALSETIGTVIGTETLQKLIKSTGVDLGKVIGSSSFKEIQSIYNEARQYVTLAEEAIDVLAKSENYTIKYVEGKEHTIANIDVTDPKMPFVVKQAVERANNTRYAIEEDRFTAIQDGYKTEYTHNGKTVYQSVNNSSLYYYGTYEEGYQYLKMVKADDGSVSFTVYKDNLSNAGGTANGNRIYENSKEEFGKGVYFTVSGGKMTYYTKVSEGVFVEKSAITYDGELFRTLRDGTKIYKDGDVYYSVDEVTGEYTRYTYSQSIKSCYEDALKENERVMAIVAALQSNTAASDNTVLDEILNRIDVNERITAKEEVVEEKNEISKYATDNVVAVTYGSKEGIAYKTIILNYNNYDINIEYEGVVYTIPAYYFVVHQD